MKKLKNIIIILVVVSIIISICIAILMQKTPDKGNNELQNIETDISEDFIKKMGLVDDYSTFFSVEEMINNFMKNVQAKEKERIYSLLENDYITRKNITEDNVLNYISDIIDYDKEVKIRKIYGQENIENSVYYVDCILEKEHKGKQCYLALYKDSVNLTYSIEPLDSKIYEQKIQGDNKELERKRIESNEYNKTILKMPTEEERAKKYFENFLENALYYPEYAYNLLDDSYKNKCFPIISDFKDYIETKRESFLSYDISNMKKYNEFETVEEYNEYLMNMKRLKLRQYKITEKEGYNQYTCIDNYGNYYTFYATSPFNYTIILGNYAEPTRDFIEKYNNSREVEKVVLNIKRFFMGIDDKNYGYSYNVLSEAFKNNKYPTKNDFIKYVKQNFFEENEIEYESHKKEKGLYIYKINIKDATGNNSEIKSFNIVLKLNSGTDFEMSFGTD